MSRRAHRAPFAIGASILVLAGAFAVAARQPLEPLWRPSSEQWVRWVHDPSDLARYAELGQWSKTDLVPYRDYIAEYPPLPVALFGVVRALTTSDRGFVALWTFITVAAGVGVLAVSRRLLSALGRSPWWLLLLSLPAGVYFTLNRFECLVILPMLAALLALHRGRNRWAGALLGLAVGVKFFPIVLLPLFLLAAARGADRRWFRSPFVLPFLATTAVAYGVPALLWRADTLVPILLQLGRQPNVGSTLFALLAPFRLGPNHPVALTLQVAFSLIAAFAAIVALLPKLPEPGASRTADLAGRSAAVLLVGVLGNAFFSPQFLLWFLPLLLLAPVARSVRWAGMLVALDLVTYAWFPLVFDAAGPTGPWSEGVALLRVALYAGTLTVLIRSILHSGATVRA